MPRPCDLQLFSMALALAMVALLACGPQAARPSHAPVSPSQAPLSVQADKEMVPVPAGRYLAGSTAQQREQAYTDYLATSGRDSARRGAWFQREGEAHDAQLPLYAIDRYPVTQAAFAEFVLSRQLEGPSISEAQWRAQGFIQDYKSQVERYNWAGREPPAKYRDHPVVLVTHAEAIAYCKWRGDIVGAKRVLPTAAQFEKAARGPSGAPYPWGSDYDPQMLNSAVDGPRDTQPINSYPRGASSVGAQGMAGNVFQWTSTPWPHAPNRFTVKGSAWDDYGGLGRAAAAHGRLASIRHAIVGFRCSTALP